MGQYRTPRAHAGLKSARRAGNRTGGHVGGPSNRLCPFASDCHSQRRPPSPPPTEPSPTAAGASSANRADGGSWASDNDRVPTDSQTRRLECVRAACSLLDAVEEYSIRPPDGAGLLVLHGLAMYARDTARAAAHLIPDHTLTAGALTRVVIEHATLAQWLRHDPEQRGGLVLQQSEVEQHRWYQVVDAAGLERPAGDEADPSGPKPKNVAPEFATARNLFGDSEHGTQLYLTYRNLSRYVHPAVTTFARYAESAPFGGLTLKPELQNGHEPEALAFYLASATVMCTLPYLDVLGDEGATTALRGIAGAADVVTTLD